MEQLNKLTSVEDYVKYYSEKLPEAAEAKNLKISRSGIIGFLFHLFGFTQSDIKNYYDSMFKEAFLATADNYKNINMAASIHGFKAQFATPAIIYGNIDIDIDALTNIYGQDFRIVVNNLEFLIDGINFILDSQYEIKANSVKIANIEGRTYNVPFSSSNPIVPIVDCRQYTVQSFSFQTPNYPYLSFHSRTFNINYEGEIWEVIAQVKTENSDEYEDYDVYTIKYTSDSETKGIFVTLTNDNRLLIECGSGKYGKHIPNSSINIKLKITKGEKGNIFSTTATPSNVDLQVYTSTGSRSSSNPSYFLGEIFYADGGKNIQKGDELRQEALKYIQSREYMMTDIDFKNVLGEYLDDFIFIFKKTNVMENDFYVFYPLKDEYQNFITSKSISVRHDEFNPDNKCEIYKPVFTDNDDIDYISPFLYICDNILRQYNTYIVHENIGYYFESIKYHKEETYNTPLPLSLNLELVDSTFETKIVVNSYQDIGSSLANFNFFITIEELGIEDMCMSNITDTSFEINYGGIIYIPVTIVISIQEQSTTDLIFTYIARNVSLVTDISDLLSLKTWDGDVDSKTITDLDFYPDSWVMNIPVILNDEFCNNANYYTNYIVNFLTNISKAKNRMISDSLQMRFVNTDKIIGINNLTNENSYDYLLRKISMQSYTFNIKFPLNLQIDIVGKSSYINENNINTNDDLDSLAYDLAEKLYNEYTGINVSIYNTQIIKMIHKYQWIKFCEVRIYDSSDDSVEIPNGNLELYDQKSIFEFLTKKEGVLFCPVYVWWDLDNISISLTYG